MPDAPAYDYRDDLEAHTVTVPVWVPALRAVILDPAGGRVPYGVEGDHLKVLRRGADELIVTYEPVPYWSRVPAEIRASVQARAARLQAEEWPAVMGRPVVTVTIQNSYTPTQRGHLFHPTLRFVVERMVGGIQCVAAPPALSLDNGSLHFPLEPGEPRSPDLSDATLARIAELSRGQLHFLLIHWKSFKGELNVRMINQLMKLRRDPSGGMPEAPAL